MITRIRAHNYRSLVDFEVRPGPVGVLIGRHGSGRSSFLHVLENLESLLRDTLALDAFPSDACTAWSERAQSFEVEIQIAGEPYVYMVDLEHGDGEYDTWVVREELRQGDDVLFTFAGDAARHVEHDAPFPRTRGGERSALSQLPAQSRDERIRSFLDWWRHSSWVVRPSPGELCEGIQPRDREVTWPDSLLGRFAPWYESATRTNPQAAAALERDLAAVLEGFVEFCAVSDEDTRSKRLHAVFNHPRSSGDATIRVGLEQLSQAEGALIQLYSLIHLGLCPGRVLCIDAPEARIETTALRRWLERLLERARQVEAQVLVVIDDPAILDQVPASAILRFERPGGGATRVVQDA
jgi:hypothetical protein